MGELITMFVDYLKSEVLPLWDPLFFFVVILGATFVLKIIEKNGVELSKSNKFWIVFIFATIASFTYISLAKFSGKLTDPQYVLFRNFLNYVAAIMFYHIVIKTSVRLFRFGVEWGSATLNRRLQKNEKRRTKHD